MVWPSSMSLDPKLPPSTRLVVPDPEDTTPICPVPVVWRRQSIKVRKTSVASATSCFVTLKSAFSLESLEYSCALVVCTATVMSLVATVIFPYLPEDPSPRSPLSKFDMLNFPAGFCLNGSRRARWPIFTTSILPLIRDQRVSGNRNSALTTSLVCSRETASLSVIVGAIVPRSAGSPDSVLPDIVHRGVGLEVLRPFCRRHLVDGFVRGRYASPGSGVSARTDVSPAGNLFPPADFPAIGPENVPSPMGQDALDFV